MGFLIVAAFWRGLAYAGLILASSPEAARHSHLIGSMLLVFMVALMLATMGHWVKYLQMFLGRCTLSGLLATASGHVSNGNTFPRLSATAVTALLVGCSLLTRAPAGRKLRVFDRVALVGFLVAVMYRFFKAAWAYDRFSSAKSKPQQQIQRPPTNQETTV